MPIRKIVDWLRGKGAAKTATGEGAPLIIVITPEQEVPGEIRIVKKLFAAGLTRRTCAGTTGARRICVVGSPKSRKIPDRIVLHGNAELVVEFGLAGLHLQSARGPRTGAGKPVRELQEGVTLSRSCHDYGELTQGPKHCAYATLGPVFPSVSKRGYAPRRTPEEYAAILDYWRTENKGHPVVALGGVTPENIGEVRRMGFAGAAVVGTVWESRTPVEAFKALVAGWDR